MASMSSPALADSSFYSSIIEKSVEAGFIRAPSSFNGRDISYIPPSRYSTFASCNCCCIVGGGRNEKAGLVLVIIMAVAAFFVGLFFTGRSIKEAQELHADLKTVESRLSNVQHPASGPMPGFSFPSAPGQPQYVAGYGIPLAPNYYQNNGPVTPPYILMGMPPQGYGYAPQPAHYQAQESPQFGSFPAQHAPYTFAQGPQPYGMPAQPVSAPPVEFVSPAQEAFQSPDAAAAVLLKGRRNERIWTAVSQGIMTVGAGLITVAILVALVAEAEILIINCSLGGAAAGLGGLALYAIRWCRPNTQEQAAANWLSAYLNNLQPQV